jgi:uncharacterized lipoprotein YmbA
MKAFSPRLQTFALATVAALLPGCSLLKPSGVQTQSFVLTPLPAQILLQQSVSTGVGVGYVKLPQYLFKTSIVMRRGTNEVVYLDSSRWAERLDTGLQRVIAADLSTLLPTDRIRLGEWRPEEVNVAVYVAVEQFDVDDKGVGVFSAWWRIVAPDSDRILKSAQFRGTRRGAAPDVDPNGATATLSALASELSQEIAKAIKP